MKARWLFCLVAPLLVPGVPYAQTAQPAVGPTALQITGLAGVRGALTGPGAASKPLPPTVGLNDDLLVRLSGGASSGQAAIPDASRYVLFLNGRALDGIPDAVYDDRCECLVFQLKRSAQNSGLWTSLLGSPTHLAVAVSVSLGKRTGDTSAAQATIFGVTSDASTFQLEVISPWRLATAFAVIMAMLALVWRRSRTNTALRDGYLPQIAPEKQTYSLARWQMAFWFTLIFASFLFLFLLLWDFNTISTQALILMGISGGTAAAAIAVDVEKDSPADAINRGLRALGLFTYADVQRVRDEITGRQTQLEALLAAPAAAAHGDARASAPAQPSAAGLQTEIQDRLNILRTYEDKTQAFETQGWFKDITTDLNGASLHRLQAFLWTWVLGAVFVIGVYRDLAMPEFGSALLALMAVSNAGYVGFKIQEQNN
jgi:hypothetical protein